MAKKNKEAFDLDSKLKRIEEIVDTLDSGEIGLEAMIELYEEGMGLSAQCRIYLENAELRISNITMRYTPVNEEETDEDGLPF